MAELHGFTIVGVIYEVHLERGSLQCRCDVGRIGNLVSQYVAGDLFDGRRGGRRVGSDT